MNHPVVLYLSGPMSGHPNYNFDAFQKHAHSLRLAGFKVASPHESAGGDQNMGKRWYFHQDFMQLTNVDAVALLPGWKTSRGSMGEVIAANLMELPVYYAQDLIELGDAAPEVAIESWDVHVEGEHPILKRVPRKPRPSLAAVGSQQWVADTMRRVFEDEIMTLREAGQKEYARTDSNAFANFERVSEDLGITREMALWTYARKHIDGIASWIKGHRSQREDVTGRINDTIVYLLLLRSMVEQDRTTQLQVEDTLGRVQDALPL